MAEFPFPLWRPLVALLYPRTLQSVKLKVLKFLIDFLDELGNFKQKKFYTFDFYTLQSVRVKQRYP